MIAALAAAVVVGLLAGGYAYHRLKGGIKHDEDTVLPSRHDLRWMIVGAPLGAAALIAAQWPHPIVAVTAAAGWLIMVPLCAIDAEAKRLPDPLNAALFAVTGIGVFAYALSENDLSILWQALTCAAAVTALHWVMAFISGGRGMGLGDVKLVPSLSLLLGVLSVPHVVLALFVGYVLALLWAVGTAVVRRQRLQSDIAFGPFLIAGTFLLLVAGLARLI